MPLKFCESKLINKKDNGVLGGVESLLSSGAGKMNPTHLYLCRFLRIVIFLVCFYEILYLPLSFLETTVNLYKWHKLTMHYYLICSIVYYFFSSLLDWIQFSFKLKNNNGTTSNLIHLFIFRTYPKKVS